MKTPSYIKYLLAFLVIFCNTRLLRAQVAEIVKVSSYNCVDYSQEFALINCDGCTDFQWTISGPHSTPHVAADGKSVDNFYWTSPGTYDVSCSYYNSGGDINFAYSNSVVIQQNVTPQVTISRSPTTNPITFGTNVTFTAAPVGGTGGSSPTYQWFLNNVAQSGQTGVQYSNSSLQNGDQVFVRMYSSNACPPEGSGDSNVITVSVTYSIAPPTVSNVQATYNTNTTLSASGANTSAGEVYRWYDFSTGGSPLHQGLSYSTAVLLNHKTFYVSIWSPNAMTESSRVPQLVTVVVPPPDAPAMSTNTCGPKTLTRGNPPANIIWYWQGTNASGQQPFNSAVTYNVAEASGQTYYIRAKATTAEIWSAPVGLKVTTDPVDIEVEAYQPQNSLVQATHSIRLKPGFKVQPGNQFTGRITISQTECNDIYNWSEEILYDQGGQPISRSRSYVTGLGQSMQSQSVDYLTGKVWASQPLYDKFNDATAGTLPAPILENDFIYKKKFVTNAATGLPYAADDFDATATLNNPNAVGNQAGTVGWYYSNNNNLEPQTPVTSYPYSRSYTPEGPDPATSTSASPGDQYKMGSGHEVKSERQLIGPNDLTHYYNLRRHFVDSSLPVTGYKHITTDPDGKKVVSFIDADGRGLASATYNNGTYDNWSYSYYNDLGQLAASVAPKGVINNPNDPNPPYPAYVTLYKYDHLGRLIETTSADEGTSRFVHSTDGKIRFSQNQEQYNASPKKFSYSNYDYLGRLIETGEYTSSAGGYVFEPHTTPSPSSNSILLQVDYVGQTQGVTRKIPAQQSYISDYSFVEYDYQPTDLPNVVPYGTLSNTSGQITKTENSVSKTWYSYNEFGQLIWTKQWIDGLADYITIDYKYDYFGNVTEVAYRRRDATISGNVIDEFYHYYEYDINQNLTKAYTSKTAGGTKTQQAAYYYYLHGPLKRMELGGNLQGIDYVYNIDGSLKLINHPDPAYDPGGDGSSGHSNFMADIFGEALDYYVNDYTGAGYNEGNVTLGSYPDKFSGLVKAVRWHSHTDSHVPRAYAFTYDERNQMDNADWGSVIGTLGSGYGVSIDVNQAYKEDIGSYDKNGNIQSLVRKGKTGNTLANYGYNYQTNTNKLSQVTTGGNNLLYKYNAIGQMIRQREGNVVLSLHYNALGLVKEIRTGAGTQSVLKYQYDDRGNRIIKTLYDTVTAGNPVSKSTYYVYDAGGNVLATYEKTGSTTQLAEVPIYGAGRIGVYKPGGTTTFYEVADHLGNVRGVIGVAETEVFSTTFETADNSTFKNYSTHDDDLMDHTDAGAAYRYNQVLNGGYNGQIGLAKSMKVSPGDKIKVEAYGKYRNQTNNDVNLNSFAATLTGAFGLSAGSPGDPGLAYNALEDYATLIAGGFDHSENSQAPKAYLNVLLFDNQHVLVDAAYRQIDAAAVQASPTVKAAHDYLTQEVTVMEPGYAYVFLSNENPKQVDVHFDDATITLIHSPIVAGADYYPFGLAMEEREVTDEDYRYGYQGQFSEKDITTGWNQFKLRNYEPRLGRWTSPDPYGQFTSSYLGMGNAPHIGVDPDGGFWGMGPIASGAVIGAGVGLVGGSIYGLANDQGNWGWYALAGAGGGAALGALGGAIYKANTYDIPGLERRIPKNANYPKFKQWQEKVFDLAVERDQVWDVAKEYVLQFERKRKVKKLQFSFNEFWGSSGQWISRNGKEEMWDVNKDWGRLDTPIFGKRGTYRITHYQIFPDTPAPTVMPDGTSLIIGSAPVLDIKVTVRRKIHGRYGKTMSYGWKKIDAP